MAKLTNSNTDKILKSKLWLLMGFVMWELLWDRRIKKEKKKRLKANQKNCVESESKHWKTLF